MPIGKLEPVEWSRNRKGAKVEGLAVLDAEGHIFDITLVFWPLSCK
jgi:hypothetical protein